ncbi:hypothetical protein IGB42_03276 [Andreprevotia sp. IGB-42]|uniref:nuclear transport factor 2 family protein n=1 Tax=Andreprevotia sp. IGB-42 TaxID=2497473 RepID=UPI001357E530|nr:nuclear transport factor 2 family protein [Andreprevotia sp. IGB-42]KAF0812286.1 hypothetical protein IGB42_03276 [Andreprevotia sp. IGB-42]
MKQAWMIWASVLLAPPGLAGMVDDTAAVRQVASDYATGWQTADAAKVAGTVHAQTVQRKLRAGSLQSADATALTAAVAGNKSASNAATDIAVLDVYHNVAFASVRGTRGTEYLQLGRVAGQWKIINILQGAQP